MLDFILFGIFFGLLSIAPYIIIVAILYALFVDYIDAGAFIVIYGLLLIFTCIPSFIVFYISVV